MSIFNKSVRCYNGGTRHNFEPRYDEAPRNLNVDSWGFDSRDDIRELSIIRVYVKDVCVWCGMVKNIAQSQNKK